MCGVIEMEMLKRSHLLWPCNLTVPPIRNSFARIIMIGAKHAYSEPGQAEKFLRRHLFDLWDCKERCSGMVVLSEPWFTVLRILLVLFTVCLVVAYVLSFKRWQGARLF